MELYYKVEVQMKHLKIGLLNIVMNTIYLVWVYVQDKIVL